MDEFCIRFAEKSDTASIMEFIDQYWKKGHILARDREFFEWQYIHYDRLCFVLGCEASGEIKGIMGFIPYDDHNEKNITIALWKTMPSSRPFLGIELLDYLITHEPHSTIMCVGILLKTTERIYKRFGFEVGAMQQWYRLAKRGEYHIAEVNCNVIPEIKRMPQYRLELLADTAQFEECFRHIDYGAKTMPEKSESYLKKRYFDHPRYQYMVYGISTDQGKTSIVVLRQQPLGEDRALRFVDYIGNYNYLPHITAALDELLLKYDAEYVDVYETGIPPETLKVAGWIQVEGSGNTIPNYFAPYEKRNITIYYSGMPGMVMFRGDGDQDRPNVIDTM